MSADTLTADGAPSTLPAPGPDENGNPSYIVGYAAIPGDDEVVTVTATKGAPDAAYVNTITATGYSLTGQVMFHTVLDDTNTAQLPTYDRGVVMAGLANGNVAVGWNNVDGASMAGDMHNVYAVVSPPGAVLATAHLGTTGGVDFPIQGDPTLYATYHGFTMEWSAQTQPAAASPDNPVQYAYQVQTFDMNGALEGSHSTPETAPYALPPTPHAFASDAAGRGVEVTDNYVNYYEPGGAEQRAVTIPGEPAHAISNEAAAMLANGDAAVAWADSGTDYVALYHASSMSFGPAIGMDWGGASDLHAVALPDGGFAVSWMNGGAYKGEVFDSAGDGGGVISLAGDVAGIDSHGDLYTVGLDSSGAEVVQTYAINGSGGGSSTGSGSTVYTSDASYTAPDGVSTIYLTGSNQTIHANNAGDTIFSDNTVNHLYGGTGDDTFHLGRGGDIVTGGGGNDVFAYAEVPWNPGQITDFGAGDVIDLTGLLHQAGYTGNDPVGAHYLDISPTIQGAELQVSAFGQLWNIGYVDNVAASDLQVTGDLVTLAGSSSGGGTQQTSVTTSEASYTAPGYVTSITLTGSQQHIDASATDGVTITSNDTGNTLIGGAGNDVFQLGRGGDNVTAGSGTDIFAYAETPWAGGTIVGFSGAAGDEVDVSGLLAKSGYAGSHPFADGYLKYTSDSSGNAQLWSDIHQPGNDGWWLVATLDGVSTASLHYAGGLIT